MGLATAKTQYAVELGQQKLDVGFVSDKPPCCYQDFQKEVE